MASFIIEGGHRLEGRIEPQGAKNEALQVLCATLLTDEMVCIENIPEILDIHNLIELMGCIGVKVDHPRKGFYRFQADELDEGYILSDDFLTRCSSLRGAVMLTGPLVARLGMAVLAKPGGDKIGRRRLDTHLQGLTCLGATLETRGEGSYLIRAERLKGDYMLLDEASVTGTANIIMAAVLAEGDTTIYNAACEPYIQQLCRMLQMMGARIEGVASNLLTIHGVGKLHGGIRHRIMPDMIEVGSFMGMSAILGGGLTIANASLEDLGIIPGAFAKLGISLEQKGRDIVVPKQDHYVIDTFFDGSFMTISDAPWPGLSPDLLSILIVVATQAKGSVLFHQKMFESRLFFVDRLIEMGAQIILCDPHRAVIVGHDHEIKLKARRMVSPDIRAGIALLMAAMSAEGTSCIDNVEQIDRGYETIEKRLNALGAKITRI